MKRIIKDVRFLIAIFVLIFVAFGGLAFNASTSGGADFTPAYGGSPPEQYASAFYFKAPVLRINETSTVSDFLVITNMAAIEGKKVFGSAVSVETSPEFKITAVKPGQSQIHLGARMRNGEVKWISCTVIVTGETSYNGNTQDPVGYCDDDNDEDIIPIAYEFYHKHETATTLVFFLVTGGEYDFEYTLGAVILQGEIRVGIVGNVARITFRSANPNFEVRFTATVNGDIVATKYVRNSL